MKKYAGHLLIALILGMYVISYICLKPLKEVSTLIARNNYAGLVIVVDAGHGGKDNGASANGFIEDELNLAVALKLKEVLALSNIEVILTRDGDYDLSSENATNHKVEDLNARIEMFEREEVVMFISIHMNKYEAAYVNGGQVFYKANDEASKQLADSIQKAFGEDLGSKKGIKVGNYYLLNNSQRLGVLVECGFLSNANEGALLSDEKYQTKVAYAIYKGILDYLNEKYVTIL